jgi:hypothetical protein
MKQHNEGHSTMTTTKTKEEVLRNLELTPEEKLEYDFWIQHVETEDYEDIQDQAWEVGSEQFFREQAMTKLVPILARAIGRELRGGEELLAKVAER